MSAGTGRGGRASSTGGGGRGGRSGGTSGGAGRGTKPTSGGRGAARMAPADAPIKRATKPKRAATAPTASATAVFPGVRYLGSIDHAEGMDHGAPEVAFIGRSNVGKSSLLNALCASAKLARVSKMPGRTQRIHLFEVDTGGGLLRLADLPGYGHAKAAAAVRAGFGPMIEGYLRGRPRLAMVLLLWDVRRDPDEETLGFLLWLREAGLRVRLCITKADKMAKNRLHGRLHALQAAFEVDDLPLAVSTQDGSGVTELRDWLRSVAAEVKRGG